MMTQLYIFQNGKPVPAKEGMEQSRQQTGLTKKSTEIQRWDDDGGKILGVPVLNCAPGFTRSAWEAFGEDDINE